MLIMDQDRRDQMARDIFINKLASAMLRDVPEFGELNEEERQEYVGKCVSAAQSKGLKTEQGMASYALAVWWLGMDFEEESQELMRLLQSDYPETRKAHALNEWVDAIISDPDNLAAADERLRSALVLSQAWGN